MACSAQEQPDVESSTPSPGAAETAESADDVDGANDTDGADDPERLGKSQSGVCLARYIGTYGGYATYCYTSWTPSGCQHTSPTVGCDGYQRRSVSCSPCSCSQVRHGRARDLGFMRAFTATDSWNTQIRDCR